MYVLIVGAGKVGWNLARELLGKQHEVTVIEADPVAATQTVEEELEHSVHYGDGSELWVLERAGIERADLVIAVTGDDEDNILISPGGAREVRRRARSWPAATTRATCSTSTCSASSRRSRPPT